MSTPKNWMSVTESRYAWEREALEFVRHRFPTHEPYRAWSNFEFIADDGTINEVDLLVCSPQGFFLIEIKSHPGRLFGDAGTWTWERDGRRSTMDNPVILANTKAKKLRSLLQRQKACRKKGQLPFLEALVFCSAEDVHCEFQGAARFRVCLRDQGEGRDARPGIMAAIQRRDCPGLKSTPKGVCDRPTSRLRSILVIDPDADRMRWRILWRCVAGAFRPLAGVARPAPLVLFWMRHDIEKDVGIAVNAEVEPPVPSHSALPAFRVVFFGAE